MISTETTVTFYCGSGAPNCTPFKVEQRSERTAIDHAREAGWFIGAIRIVFGIAKRKRRTQRVEFCPHCKWRLGVGRK